MGKAEREKGKRMERWVAGVFNDAGILAKRTGWMQSDETDEKVQDIMPAVPDVSTGPFAIECKHKKAHQPWSALAQAKEAANGKIPIAILKRKPREPVLVVMDLEDFLKLHGGSDEA